MMVPHWVRGEETAALTECTRPGFRDGAKVILTALGGSVATPPAGLNADVIVARDFDELKSLGKERVEGKIVLFNYPFDKKMAAEGRGGESLWRSGRLPQRRSQRRRPPRRSSLIDSFRRGRGLSIAAHGCDPLRR